MLINKVKEKFDEIIKKPELLEDILDERLNEIILEIDAEVRKNENRG